VTVDSNSLPSTIGTTAFQINGDNSATFTSTVTATGFLGNATTATNISNTGTVTLASASESNELTVIASATTITRGLNFRWYATNWKIGNIRGGGTDSIGFGFDLDGVRKATIGIDGGITATAFYASSDARLKDIISQNGDTIEFTWKDKRDDKKHIGYIAQEIQQTYPNQVSEGEDGMLSVNYIEVLVAKIQELENRLKKLENGI
jgi:hypothetical protein